MPFVRRLTLRCWMLSRFVEGPEIGVVVFTGEGDKAFCSGVTSTTKAEVDMWGRMAFLGSTCWICKGHTFLAQASHSYGQWFCQVVAMYCIWYVI